MKKVLKVANKDWEKQRIASILAEGEKLVNNPRADVADLVRFGRRFKGKKLPESLAGDDSWQKAIVGLIVYGPDAYKLEHLEWCAYSAPDRAFLTISFLLREKSLPKQWIMNALNLAHYSVQGYEWIIYKICNGHIHKKTIKKWLNCDNNPCWQIAAICGWSNRNEDAGLDNLCIETYEKCLKGGRFDSPWLEQIVNVVRLHLVSRRVS